VQNVIIVANSEGEYLKGHRNIRSVQKEGSS
jgi:hypothetical protein